ncbi:hypothetical protein A3H85_00990 [Candidatus Daviesbacteria bacterium RIFCSPLOWO2_02_FULL_40_8]|nr:MAG: hypothetical protein A3H85_00990 [Candidatus Daviesbacteria bacterium RIFCSPLOWO2_02_FULL_40_8]
MLVFIDDSGDPGFKLDKGSSLIFVISCVIFDDELEAEKTAVAIKEFRRRIRFPDDVEFKFNKSSKKTREKFLEAINSFHFKVRSLVIQKDVIKSEELKGNKNSFYSYAIKLLLQHSDGSILNAKVRVDGSGDRIFRKSFVAYLRKQLNSEQRKVMKDCKLVDSKENVLVQMADMIAGSIRRAYELDKTDRETYKKIIRKHIEDEWRFR